MSLDQHAAEVALLDPRLSVSHPDCFLCGKRVVRANAVWVESGASPRMPAHSECANVMCRRPLTLMARYWMAVRAAVIGRPEAPNPCEPLVRGSFQ